MTNKLWNVLFDKNKPTKAKLLTEQIPNMYSNGSWYKTSSSYIVIENIIVEATSEDDAIQKAKEKMEFLYGNIDRE